MYTTIAVAALCCYAFYVPLSIMITPMLLEAPRTEKDEAGGDGGGGVTYLKLYLMSINVIKSVMLLIAVLGPQSVTTTVVSSVASSVVLGTVTMMWFHYQKIEEKPYSAEIHPCNIAFINYWKAASYTASVASAVIVVIAYNLQDSVFPTSLLTIVLIASWCFIIIVFSVAYYQFRLKTSERGTLVTALIEYPYIWRNRKESYEVSETNGEVAWVLVSPHIPSGGSIPGFEESPWHDELSESLSSKYKISTASNDPHILDYNGNTFMGEILVCNEVSKL